MKLALGIVTALLLTGAVQAQEPVLRLSPWAHIKHYARTHKELLVSDALVAASFEADAVSSTHCQKALGEDCIEHNPLLGKHPSEAVTYGYLTGLALSVGAFNHIVVRLANSDPDKYGYYRHFIWLPTAAVAGVEFSYTWNNIRVTEQGQAERQSQARARLR